MAATHYDVIIVGTGAGGGTLACRLAPAGKRILLLERGDFLPREKENWDTSEVFVRNRYTSTDTWYDNNGNPFQPGSHYFVGGGDEAVRGRPVSPPQGRFWRAEAPRRPLASLADQL